MQPRKNQIREWCFSSAKYFPYVYDFGISRADGATTQTTAIFISSTSSFLIKH
jgi:hypothetical protein